MIGGLFIGIIIGGCIGVVIMAIMCMAKEEDNQIEDEDDEEYHDIE